jgi:hypothetical protein
MFWYYALQAIPRVPDWLLPCAGALEPTLTIVLLCPACPACCLQTFAKGLEYPLLETSAQASTNVEQAFNLMAAELLKRWALLLCRPVACQSRL